MSGNFSRRKLRASASKNSSARASNAPGRFSARVSSDAARAARTKASSFSSARKKTTPPSTPSGFASSAASISQTTPSVPSLPMNRSIASIPGAT
jgi:hypothetical protein